MSERGRKREGRRREGRKRGGKWGGKREEKSASGGGRVKER